MWCVQLGDHHVGSFHTTETIWWNWGTCLSHHVGCTQRYVLSAMLFGIFSLANLLILWEWSWHSLKVYGNPRRRLSLTVKKFGSSYENDLSVYDLKQVSATFLSPLACAWFKKKKLSTAYSIMLDVPSNHLFASPTLELLITKIWKGFDLLLFLASYGTYMYLPIDKYSTISENVT